MASSSLCARRRHPEAAGREHIQRFVPGFFEFRRGFSPEHSACVLRFAGFVRGHPGARSGTRSSVHSETSSGASLDRIIISKEALKNITPLSAGRNAARDPRSARSERGHALRDQGQHCPKGNQAENGEAGKTSSGPPRRARSAAGKPFTKNSLFRLLTNVMYTGKADYKGTIYNGEHDGIVDVDLWQRVQDALRRNGGTGNRTTRPRT